MVCEFFKEITKLYRSRIIHFKSLLDDTYIIIEPRLHFLLRETQPRVICASLCLTVNISAIDQLRAFQSQYSMVNSFILSTVLTSLPRN